MRSGLFDAWRGSGDAHAQEDDAEGGEDEQGRGDLLVGVLAVTYAEDVGRIACKADDDSTRRQRVQVFNRCLRPEDFAFQPAWRLN